MTESEKLRRNAFIWCTLITAVSLPCSWGEPPCQLSAPSLGVVLGPLATVDFPDAACQQNETEDGSLLTCSNGFDSKWTKGIHRGIHHLILTDWPESCFPPALILQSFPSLKSLTISNSSVLYMEGDFPRAHHLVHIQFNNLKNIVLNSTLFSLLPALQILDLTNNSLETIDPDLLSGPETLTTVYLANNRWNCNDTGINWLSNLNTTSREVAASRIKDYHNLTCQGAMYPGKPLDVVMDLMKSLREKCPAECACSLTNLVRNPSGELFSVSTADCRWKGLRTLPASLPPNITVLLLHGNEISELRPLAQNPAYRRVGDVYLDDNQVSSVAALEGADWLMNFRVFSLRGNNLTQIPTHFFDHAFSLNPNFAKVYLGKNPWSCDCQFVPAFQELLLKYESNVRDMEDITCYKPDLPGQQRKPSVQISTLTRSAICRLPDEFLQPIDILNIVLASLIVMVLGKLAYDYYFFKKTGQLPWIVTKMP